MCIPPGQSKILSQMARLLLSYALPSEVVLNPVDRDALGEYLVYKREDDCKVYGFG